MQILCRKIGIVSEIVPDLGPERVLSDPDLAPVLARFRVMNTAGGRPSLAYVRDLPGEEFVAEEEDEARALEPQPGRALNPLDIQAIWVASMDLAWSISV